MKKKQRFLTIIYLLAMFLSLAAVFSCAGGPKIDFGGAGSGGDPVPFISGARTGTLPSGLRYYLLENARPEGRAFLTLAVNAGSVLETDEERGLAHFVEHMAFNGTARFAKSELVNYLRSLGMRFGPEVNAYTSFDETVYGIEVPVETGPGGRKLVPEKALAVIDDWTWSVAFNAADVDNERQVIMEEYRSRLGAGERISREIFSLLFRGSPYAERLPIGTPEVIESAPARRLEDFYRKWYRPENMAIIIVGDFDAAYLESVLPGHFPVHEGEGLPAGGGPKFSRPLYDLAGPGKGRLETLILTDSELSQSRVDLYWKRAAEPRLGDLAHYREGIIDYLTNTMLALRFEEAAIKSETPYVFAGAGQVRYGFSSRFYVFVARPKTALTGETLKELFTVKESLCRYGFTPDETDSAKAALVSALERMVSEKDRQPSGDYVDSFTRHFLAGETIPDLEWELETVRKLLPGIVPEEINRAVKNYFAGDDLSVIISAPDAEKESLPSGAEIKTLAAEIRKAEIAPPSTAKAREELLPEIPASGTIVSESVDAETGALLWELGNGAKLILKETHNKNNEIVLYAQARGGTLSAPDEAAVSASLASEMLNASGLGSYSRSELTKMLLDKQVALSFWTQSFLRGFQGSASVQDVKTLFEMLHLSFTQPRFDDEAVKALLDQMRSSMAFRENDPNTVFGREISRTVYGNSRFYPLELADLDRADMNEAGAFIAGCLNPADYTFVLTGNLDPGQLRPLVETYLASVPPSQPFNEWADTDPERPPDTEREIRKGKENRSAVYLGWFIPQNYTEEESAACQALSEYLDIQLTEEIREALGGVYSISSWASLSPLPRGELSGGVYFFCDPRRVEELTLAVKEEFRKIARGTVDGDVFGKAVEALIKGEEQSIQSNLYIAQSYANSDVIYRSPLNRLDRRPALYRALTPAAVQAAAEELISGNLVRLVLNPE